MEVSKLTIESGTYDIKDAKARNNIQEINQSISNINASIEEIEKYIPSIKQSEYNHLLIVTGVKGSQFQTINQAITYAKTLNPSLSNKVCILILPNVYNERIVLNDVHGLILIGLDKDSTIIQESGVYPDCVMHVQGDVSFKNLTLKNTTNDTYIVHVDPSDTNVQGTVIFENCIFNGGKNGIGYGSGNNTTLKLLYCEFIKQTSYHVYAHNSPYASNNQNFYMIGCIFNNQEVLQMDDAGATYGETNTSKFNLYFKDNICINYSCGFVLFRPNTNDLTQNKKYIESNNMRQGLGCNGNSNIPALNSNIDNFGGVQKYNSYIYIPPAGADNYSHVTLPFNGFGGNFNVKINSLTLPGVGYFTSDVGLENKGANFINFMFNNNPSIIGKVCILNFTVEIGV